jgi:hypothetical protein
LPLRNLDLHVADHARWPHRAGTPAAAAIVAQSGDTFAACYTAAQTAAPAAEAFELALEAETLLALFAELALGALGGELRGGVGGLELVDCLEQTLDLVAGLGEVFGQDGDGLFAALDLRLEILDCAVDVAYAASFGVAALLQVFELLFELRCMLV